MTLAIAAGHCRRKSDHRCELEWRSQALAPGSEPSGTSRQVVRGPCESRAGQRPRPAATSSCREPASGHVSVCAGASRCYDRPRQLQGRAAISALKSARMTGSSCPSAITLPEAMRVSLVRYPPRSFLEIAAQVIVVGGICRPGGDSERHQCCSIRQQALPPAAGAEPRVAASHLSQDQTAHGNWSVGQTNAAQVSPDDLASARWFSA